MSLHLGSWYWGIFVYLKKAVEQFCEGWGNLQFLKELKYSLWFIFSFIRVISDVNIMSYHHIVFYSHVKIGEIERSSLRSWWWDWSLRRKETSEKQGGSMENARRWTKGIYWELYLWVTQMFTKLKLSKVWTIDTRQAETNINERSCAWA